MSRLIEKLFERLIVRKLVVGGSTSEHLIMHEKKNTIIYVKPLRNILRYQIHGCVSYGEFILASVSLLF